jgi:hypothetical protein
VCAHGGGNRPSSACRFPAQRAWHLRQGAVSAAAPAGRPDPDRQDPRGPPRPTAPARRRRGRAAGSPSPRGGGSRAPSAPAGSPARCTAAPPRAGRRTPAPRRGRRGRAKSRALARDGAQQRQPALDVGARVHELDAEREARLRVRRGREPPRLFEVEEDARVEPIRIRRREVQMRLQPATMGDGVGEQRLGRPPHGSPHDTCDRAHGYEDRERRDRHARAAPRDRRARGGGYGRYGMCAWLSGSTDDSGSRAAGDRRRDEVDERDGENDRPERTDGRPGRVLRSRGGSRAVIQTHTTFGIGLPAAPGGGRHGGAHAMAGRGWARSRAV